MSAQYFGAKVKSPETYSKSFNHIRLVSCHLLQITYTARNNTSMGRRKRQALSRIANLSADGSAKRRKMSPDPEGIPSGKENQPVRGLECPRV